MKTCYRCKKNKPQTEFTPSAWRQKSPWCRACRKAYDAVRTKELWAAYKASPEYKGGPGRPPSVETAIRRALRNERIILQREVREVQKAVDFQNSGRQKFRERCNLLGLDFDDIWIAYTSMGLGKAECQICQIKEADCPRNLAIDHCHETGRFRGFLCTLCNTGLGALGDTLESLGKAMKYLSNQPPTRNL